MSPEMKHHEFEGPAGDGCDRCGMGSTHRWHVPGPIGSTRMPPGVEEALVRLEHALMNAGLYCDPLVLELERDDFRRLFWPRNYLGTLATYTQDAMGVEPRLPEAAFTTESFRWGRWEIRQRKG
jgi:hypothetical protein